LCKVSEPEVAFGLLVDGALPMGEAVGVEPEPEPASAPQSEKPSQPAASLVAGVVVDALPNGELEIALSGQQWRIRGMASVKAGSGTLKVNAQVLDTESGVVFAD
ncbi:DNA primase, partial [Pectobacterium versatile]